MIDKAYVVMMARYNRWQNDQLSAIVTDMGAEELDKDRRAFFGSIRATLNHILWGDTLWMSRWCADVDAPSGPAAEHINITPNIATWCDRRFSLDGRIRIWAETLRNPDLSGDMTWHAPAAQQDFTRPIAACVVHFFNHQIHHRGQVHAMLTDAGKPAPVTDLVYLQDDD